MPPPARSDSQLASARRSWRPRFTLTTMMLVLLVSAMTATGGRFLVQGLAGGASGRAMFVISVLVLPMLLLLGANAFRLAFDALGRSRRRR